MMSQTKIAAILSLLALFMITSSSCTSDTPDTSENSNVKGFAEYMYFMQLYSHKALLSIDAENAELADFYIHELEETTEDVIEYIKEYGGFPISQLTESMLLPTVEDLEDELETGNWESIREKARIMIESCNTCHVATDHGYIVIPHEVSKNPYLQTF